MNIHVMGVGKMGLPLALHLLAAGHSVSVSDPVPERQRDAAARGLAVADDMAQAVAGAQVIVSSLPHDEALRDVTEWVATLARVGAVYADTSTVSLEASARTAARCDSRGVRYVRAPLSGNNKMAESAQLTVLASGPRDAYDEMLPLFKLWGPSQFYLGEGEQARLMKLVVNLMIAQTSAMLAEALALGRKGGLDWRDMWQVLGASAVASPILKAKGVQLAARDFKPTFTVQQMTKDLGLILDAGQALQVPLAQTAMTHQWMHAAQAQGNALDDYAAIIKVIERSAGLTYPPP